MSDLWTLDTTSETFEQDVFEASKERLIVLDFWAPWCQPCLMLKPILESLATEYAGRFRLVKANADNLQREAAQFGVQGIPAVFAVLDGQPVDGFQGVLAEGDIKAWLDRLLEASDLIRAKSLEESAPAEALDIYETLLQNQDDFSPALIGKARIALAGNDAPTAQAILEQLEQRGFLEEEAKDLKAQLDLDTQSGDFTELQARVEREPNNLECKVELGKALAGAKRYEQAMSTLLEVIEADKTGPGEQARLLILEIFRVLPDDSELTTNYRRKLSALLF